MALPLLALMGAQTALSVMQNRQAAKEQSKYAIENAEAAIEAKTYDDRATNENLRQTDVTAKQNKRQVLINAIRQQSTAKATGNTLAGASVDRIEQSITNQLGQALEDLSYNLEGAFINAEMQKKGSEAKAQSRINAVPTADYNPTMDLIQGGLSIATAGRADHAAASKAAGKDLSFSEWAGLK